MLRIACISNMVLIAAAAASAQQVPLQIISIQNSASKQEGLPGGGGLATILLTRLPAGPGTFTASTSPLPYRLYDFEVTINGAPAPLLEVFVPAPGDNTPARIDFQVPMERNATLRAGGQDVGGWLAVARRGSGIVGLTQLPTSALGGFFSDANGYAIAKHTDGTPVSLDNAARPGETIIVYANDFFFVWPPPAIGYPVPEQPAFEFRYTLKYGEHLYLQEYPGMNAPFFHSGSFATTPEVQMTFRGLAANQIGVEEIHFIVPANQKPGDWALFFNVGSCPDRGGPCDTRGSSSAYVKLPVR